MEKIELVIIGAGPAGLAAAAEAVRRGIKSILLLERNPRPGGILNQCIHDGFGLERFGESLTGPEYIGRFLPVLDEPGVRLVTSAMALRLSPGPEIVYSDTAGLHTVRAGAVILATGCRERTRGAIRIPGTRPSGVYTAGVVQHLTNIDNVLVGKRAVILGSGDIGLIMARRLTLEGMQIACVLEKLPYCSGLARNVRQCLRDYDIPLYLGTTVTEILGAHRLEAVVAAEVDARGAEKPGTRRTIPCDTLILSVGLIPENELARACGIEMDAVTGGAKVDGRLMTNVPGVFSCGNGLHVHDIVDMVSMEAETAARHATEFIEGAAQEGKQICVEPGAGVRYTLPRSVLPGEKTTLSLRVSAPGRMQSVRVLRGENEIAVKRMRRLSPAEMIRIPLPALTGDAPLAVTLRQDEAEGGAPESEGLICTVCPNGCALRAKTDENGALRIEGALCKRGEAFGLSELTDPRRTLTTSMRVNHGIRPLVSVKTARPVRRDELFSIMEALRRVRAEAPVTAGQELANPGVPVIATGADERETE